MKLILCSNSKRRQELIKLLKKPFIVYPVKINENIKTNTPEGLVKKLALIKAIEGAKKFSTGISIGADTIVVSNKNEIICKPKNLSDAFKILKKLNGTWHKVLTGIALINCSNGKTIVDYQISRVKMRKLKDIQIKILAKKHLDKAGAYAVQEKNDKVIEKIIGDYYNVVGFPIKKLSVLIKKICLLN